MTHFLFRFLWIKCAMENELKDNFSIRVSLTSLWGLHTRILGIETSGKISGISAASDAVSTTPENVKAMKVPGLSCHTIYKIVTEIRIIAHTG